MRLRVERCTQWPVDWPLVETQDDIYLLCSYAAARVRQPRQRYADLVRTVYQGMRELVSHRCQCSIQQANSIVATACSISNCSIFGLDGFIAGVQEDSRFLLELSIAGCLPKSMFCGWSD